MNALLFYALVAVFAIELSHRDRRRDGAQIGLVIFAGVTWFLAVAMISFSATAGLVAGGLAAGATAVASAPPRRVDRPVR